MSTSATFTKNANIFGKVYFPRLIIPLSVVISNLAKFFLQFMLFLGFVIFYELSGDSSFQPSVDMVFLPVLIIIMAGLGLGVGILISALTTKYRDLQNLVAFGVQLMMFVSTLLFPLSNSMHDGGGWMSLAVKYNPMSPIIEGFRNVFFNQGVFEWSYILYSAAVMMVILIVGVLAFRKIENTFMDTV
jgi:lipopolysaccharide transport system permease protein